MMEDIDNATTNVQEEPIPVATPVHMNAPIGQPGGQDEVLNFAAAAADGEAEDDVEDGPKSSFENVLPMDKLKKGWAQWSVFAKTQATALQNKAQEIQQSEEFQKLKAKTEATLKQTQEAVIPYFEKTVEVTAPYVAKAKENAAIVAERARPHVEAGVSAAKEWVAQVAEKAGGKQAAQGENMTV